MGVLHDCGVSSSQGPGTCPKSGKPKDIRQACFDQGGRLAPLEKLADRPGKIGKGQQADRRHEIAPGDAIQEYRDGETQHADTHDKREEHRNLKKIDIMLSKENFQPTGDEKSHDDVGIAIVGMHPV